MNSRILMRAILGVIFRWESFEKLFFLLLSCVSYPNLIYTPKPIYIYIYIYWTFIFKYFILFFNLFFKKYGANWFWINFGLVRPIYIDSEMVWFFGAKWLTTRLISGESVEQATPIFKTMIKKNFLGLFAFQQGGIHYECAIN